MVYPAGSYTGRIKANESDFCKVQNKSIAYKQEVSIERVEDYMGAKGMAFLKGIREYVSIFAFIGLTLRVSLDWIGIYRLNYGEVCKRHCEIKKHPDAQRVEEFTANIFGNIERGEEGDASSTVTSYLKCDVDNYFRQDIEKISNNQDLVPELDHYDVLLSDSGGGI